MADGVGTMVGMAAGVGTDTGGMAAGVGTDIGSEELSFKRRKVHPPLFF